MRHRQWLLLLVSLLSPGLVWAQASYTLTDLGAQVRPNDIANTSDTVVGTVRVGGQDIAHILSPTLQPLGTLPGGVTSRATGVAPGPLISVESSTGTNGVLTHAALIRGGGLSDLGTTGAPGLFSTASAVNAGGMVSGTGDSPDGTHIVALRWDSAGVVSILPSLTADGACGSTQLNDSGDAIGFCLAADQRLHGIVWPLAGGLVDLGERQTPVDINATGQIVGRVVVGTTARGFVRTATTPSQILDPLPGDEDSSATGINASGLIVGRSAKPDPNVAAFLHQTVVRWVNGVAEDVLPLITNNAGWVLLAPTGVNDAGSIIGIGLLNGEPHGFLLVPETPPSPVAPVPQREEPKREERSRRRR